MPKPRTPRDLADARFSRDLDETADELVVGEGVALDVQPAGLVLRLAAALLDGLCVLVLFVLAMFGGARLWPRGLEPAWGAALNIVLLVVVLVLVPAAVETVTKGRSVGRFATGTRVVRLDGGSIGFRHAFTRSLVGLFELWMTFRVGRPARRTVRHPAEAPRGPARGHDRAARAPAETARPPRCSCRRN
ncbi:RDD family protein [Curtobacterium flaccumfaciens]|nr:RDD family protein [Curtobacterium flaccumfaciens]